MMHHVSATIVGLHSSEEWRLYNNIIQPINLLYSNNNGHGILFQVSFREETSKGGEDNEDTLLIKVVKSPLVSTATNRHNSRIIDFNREYFTGFEISGSLGPDDPQK